jgi:hypothetical protein
MAWFKDTENISPKQEREMKQEAEAAKARRHKIYERLYFFTLALGNFAVASFLTILNADPQVGHWILGGIATVSALTFTYKLIWE